MIKEAYCSYEVSNLLKENGFDEPCSSTYDTAVSGGKPKFYKYDVLHFFPNGMKNSDDKYGMVISAPTHQMACAWLREKYKLHITVDCIDVTEHGYVFTSKIVNMEYVRETKVEDYFYSFEDAVEDSIKYCLENLI